MPPNIPPPPKLLIEVDDDTNDSLLVSTTLTPASASALASAPTASASSSIAVPTILHYVDESFGAPVSVSSPEGIALLETADESVAVERRAGKDNRIAEVATSNLTSQVCTDFVAVQTQTETEGISELTEAPEANASQTGDADLAVGPHSDGLAKTFQEQIDALEELLASAENREAVLAPLFLVKTWRNKTFASIVTKNSALQRAEKAEKTRSDTIRNLREVEESCAVKLKLMNAKVRQSESLVEAEVAKRLESQRTATACKVMANESQRVSDGLIEWATNFTSGSLTEPRVSRDNSEKKYERRGIHIIDSIGQRKAISPAQARENALSAGCDLLESYEKKLNKLTLQLQNLSVHLAAKDAHLRNEQAALAVEKASWRKLTKTPGGRMCRTALSSETEAIMRGIFKKLEGRSGVGKVEIRRLITVLRSDAQLGRAMDYALHGEGWMEILLTLEEMLSGENENAMITWGEFLLAFIEGGIEELGKYKTFSIPSPREIAINSGEEAYSHSLLDTVRQPHEHFQIAHLELVMPLSGRKTEGESHLRSLERTGVTELRNTVRRLTRERAWCMDTIHRLCVQGPRIQALDAARRTFGKSLERLKRQVETGEEELKLKEIEASRLKGDLGQSKNFSDHLEKQVQTLNKKFVDEAGLRSKLELTERRCDTYKVRLDQGEEELGESKRKESAARKEGSKLAARVQAALREAARGEKRLINLMGESKRREKDLLDRVKEVESLNANLRARLAQVENDYRLYEARVGGVWEGMGMAERAPSSPARSSRNMASWLANLDRGGTSVKSNYSDVCSVAEISKGRGIGSGKSEREGENDSLSTGTSVGAVTYPPRSVAESTVGSGRRIFDHAVEQSIEIDAPHQPRHPPSVSMVTRVEQDLFSRLNDITALTNEILSDKGG